MVRLGVGALSHDAAVDLVRRLERSPHFTSARIDSEAALPPTPGQPDTVHFDITAVYLPSFARPQKLAAEPKAEAKPAKSAPPAKAMTGVVHARLLHGRRRLAMPAINETRRRFSVLMIVLGCICVVAVGVLVSPIGRGARSADQRVTDLQRELIVKTREVAPLNGIDKKVVIAKDQIDAFYAGRLPQNYSSISEELGKLASENKVRIATGRYEDDRSDVPGRRAKSGGDRDGFRRLCSGGKVH